MFEFRQKSDYKDLVKFEIKEVRLWLSRAGEFIKAIRDTSLNSLASPGKSKKKR